MPPSISIIIPAFNAESFIGEAIRSTLDQISPAVEVIVVDDGSTDSTASVASTFGAEVLVIRQPNAGESAARNRGLTSARGDAVLFLDADDVLPSNALRDLGAGFDADHSADLAYGCVAYFGDGVGTPGVREHAMGAGGRILETVIRGDTLLPGQFCVRRELVERVGPFRTDLRYGEDWEFLLRLAGQARCVFVPQTVLRKRVHPRMQSLERNRPDIVEQRLAILRGVFGRDFENVAKPLLTRRVLADWRRSFAFSLADSGSHRQACGQFWRSLALWPFQPALWVWLAVQAMRRKSG